MQKKHALLSASGASRWLTCPPSARLEEKMPSSESIYADEGTLAHELGEWLIRQKAFGVNVDHEIARIMANELYNEEMMGYCEEYADFVIEQIHSMPAGAFFIQEQRLNLTEYIPEGFGTVDNCIVSDEWLTIIDLKYGKGVPVNAYENKQLMVYALGAYEEYKLLYELQNVRMVIYQPRIDNSSVYEISTSDLVKWGREVLYPGALKAFEGIGDFIPGEHCRFCRVRPTCKAFAAHNLQVAAREFEPVVLTDEQIVKVLLRAGEIKKWLTSVEEYALQEALSGRKFPGLKLVKGRSVRKISDEEAVLAKIKERKIDPGIVTKPSRLEGITNLQKLLTKEQFKDCVEPFLVKPDGKPTLTVEEDNRPEFNSTQSAADDFS